VQLLAIPSDGGRGVRQLELPDLFDQIVEDGDGLPPDPLDLLGYVP
jgi:hypothetical protein